MLCFSGCMVVLGCVLSMLSLIGCGKNPSHSDTWSVKNNLVFRRSDGTQVGFNSKTFVWCGPWEGDEIPVTTLNILVGFDPKDPEKKANWQLRAVVSDVKIGEEIKFPNTYIWNQPKGVSLFVYDPPNELSNDQEESNGGIVFQKLRCGIIGEVQFTISAVIASELGGGDSLMVSGTFYAPITGSPVVQ